MTPQFKIALLVLGVIALLEAVIISYLRYV